MIRQFIKGRVYVFIDAANILYSQQTLGWRVDYKKLKKYFEDECDLQVLYFYTGRVGENHKQNAFLGKLQSLGGYVYKGTCFKRTFGSREAHKPQEIKGLHFISYINKKRIPPPKRGEVWPYYGSKQRYFVNRGKVLGIVHNLYFIISNFQLQCSSCLGLVGYKKPKAAFLRLPANPNTVRHSGLSPDVSIVYEWIFSNPTFPQQGYPFVQWRCGDLHPEDSGW